MVITNLTRANLWVDDRPQPDRPGRFL